MLEGYLFYDENDDKWILKTCEKEFNISSLIYGFADLGNRFPDFVGNGEFVKISLEVNVN